MATYRKDKGGNVKSYSADPDRTYPSGMEGKLYYNSSDGQFKYVGLGAAAWSSGGNLNTGRPHLGGFGATNSAHIATGGHKASAPNRYDLTEEYNGSAWSEVGDLNTARETFGSAGATSTAGIIFSGYEAPPPSLVSQKTEEWNGSAWSEEGDLNDQRYLVGGFGTSTSAIAATGYDASADANQTNVESWNGSSWTEITEVNTPRRQSIGAGASNTSGFITAGKEPSVSAKTEEWNGSAWSEEADLNTARQESGSHGAGGVSDGLVMAALNASSTALVATESYNGTSWTEVADLSQARHGGSSGTNSAPAALFYGGVTEASEVYHANTEEWSFSHTFKKVTTG